MPSTDHLRQYTVMFFYLLPYVLRKIDWIFKNCAEDICFLLAEAPEEFPGTDIGIVLVKVDDALLSLPKTKVIIHTVQEQN